jgi:hypothetical protein
MLQLPSVASRSLRSESESPGAHRQLEYRAESARQHSRLAAQVEVVAMQGIFSQITKNSYFDDIDWAEQAVVQK